MDEGGKGLFKRKKEEKTSDPGDREKGAIYYDEEARGFFEVKEGKQGTYSQELTGKAGDSQKVIDYLEEIGVKDLWVYQLIVSLRKNIQDLH